MLDKVARHKWGISAVFRWGNFPRVSLRHSPCGPTLHTVRQRKWHDCHNHNISPPQIRNRQPSCSYMQYILTEFGTALKFLPFEQLVSRTTCVHSHFTSIRLAITCFEMCTFHSFTVALHMFGSNIRHTSTFAKINRSSILLLRS